MPLMADDGSFNVTVVDGSAYTGVQALDGSYNVVQTDGSTLTGIMHPCGAYYVVLAASSSEYDSPHHACGAYYVSQGTYIPNTMKVTAVSGTLT